MLQTLRSSAGIPNPDIVPVQLRIKFYIKNKRSIRQIYHDLLLFYG